jgi:hypothetical protein
MPEETPAGLLNMDEIVRAIVEDHGIYAYLEHTGGGCATIYAGARDKEGYFQAVAGPGNISWVPEIPSTGHVDEFYVSPDDQGDTKAADVTELGATTEAAIAELIVRLVRTGSVQPT